MAAGLNTAGLQFGAAGIAAGVDHISLHTAVPDNTGSALSSAGKVAVTCTAAGGNVTVPQTAFTGGAASGAVVAVGFWNGSTWLGYDLLNTAPPNDTAFNAAGQYTTNASTISGLGA